MPSLVPRPFLVGGVRKGRGKKGLVNNLTLHSCLRGKCKCQIGVNKGYIPTGSVDE